MAQGFAFESGKSWKMNYPSLVQDLMKSSAGQATGILIAALLCPPAERTKIFKEYIENQIDHSNPLSTLLSVKIGTVIFGTLTINSQRKY